MTCRKCVIDKVKDRDELRETLTKLKEMLENKA